MARDAFPDVVGRVYSRPLAVSGEGSFFELAQIGVSARYGARDQEYVDCDYPAIATGQGFVLWQPAYTDSYGRLNRVLPSGDQWALGGELRLPFDLPGGRAIDVRGEAYWVSNGTREAIDGTQLSNTERFGRMEGIGWYAMVSFWAWGDAFVSGEPGLWRPVTVDPSAPPELLRGLEICSGGLRIHDLDVLEVSLGRKGIDPAGMESYLRVFRSAAPPHGGFGVGLERLVQKLLDLPNVRYAALFPRDRSRLTP